MAEVSSSANTIEAKIKKIKKPMAKKTKVAIFTMLGLSLIAVGLWLVQKLIFGYNPSIGDVAGEMFPSIAFTVTLFGTEFSISQSVVSGWITVGTLIVIAIFYRCLLVPKFKVVPSKIQVLGEYIVSFFDNSSKSIVGHVSKSMGPIVFAMAAFICVGTLMEMLGIRPPNADINTCIAMAISTFILINFYGLKELGFKKRLMHYVKPIPLIGLITDIAVPISMTFRLFGSILSGFLIMSIIYSVIAPVVPAFLSLMFTWFHAFIQSYIFAILSLTFVGEAIE